LMVEPGTNDAPRIAHMYLVSLSAARCSVLLNYG
jgi:hypothetical protein